MHDVIVIGAGPAGSAAAYHACRRGLRVLLVDRVAFPRPTTCGDALVPRALAALARMGITDLPGHAVHAARFIHMPSGQDRRDDFEEHAGPRGLVVERALLDATLLDTA